MKKGKVFAFLIAMAIGIWMGKSAVEIIDGIAAKEATGSLIAAPRE